MFTLPVLLIKIDQFNSLFLSILLLFLAVIALIHLIKLLNYIGLSEELSVNKYKHIMKVSEFDDEVKYFTKNLLENGEKISIADYKYMRIGLKKIAVDKYLKTVEKKKSFFKKITN